MKYENLLSEKSKLEALMKTNAASDEHQQLLQLKYKTYQLEQENKDLKQKLHIEDDHEQRSAPEAPKAIDKSFREQIPVSDDHYKIPIAIRNKMVGSADERAELNSKMENFQMNPNEQSQQNVLQQPMPMNGKSTTTTTTPTSVVKKENQVSPVKAQSTSTKASTRIKPLPKGE